MKYLLVYLFVTANTVQPISLTFDNKTECLKKRNEYVGISVMYDGLITKSKVIINCEKI